LRKADTYWGKTVKIFLDMGDVKAVRKAYDTGLLDGVTTNANHIAKTEKRFKDAGLAQFAKDWGKVPK